MALKLIHTHTHTHPEAPPRARWSGSEALRARERADGAGGARERAEGAGYAGARADGSGSPGERASSPAAIGAELHAICARVYAHWRLMLRTGRPVAPHLTPQRRAVVLQALEWGYDEETLALAVEGCACCPWHAGGNKFGRAFDDFGFILASEERIERLADKGRAFRERCATVQARAAEQGAHADQVSIDGPTAEQRAAMVEVRRKLAERMRAGR